MRGFLFEVCNRPGSILIYNDNLSALKLTEHPGFHARTKHIDVRYHYIRELYQLGKISVSHMSGKLLPADVLTKGLRTKGHFDCIVQFGVD